LQTNQKLVEGVIHISHITVFIQSNYYPDSSLLAVLSMLQQSSLIDIFNEHVKSKDATEEQSPTGWCKHSGADVWRHEVGCNQSHWGCP
jgi:hypothetical protein